MTFRHSLALVALFAAPLAAQDYSLITQGALAANASSMAPEARCLLAAEGSILYYDSANGAVVLYDPEAGSDTGVFLSKADLDATAGITIDRCNSAHFDDDLGIYFAFGNADDEVVLRFNGEGDVLTRVVAAAQSAGITALETIGETLYLGRVNFFGAAQDGISSVSATAVDGTPVTVVDDGDLDIFDLVALDGTLYGTSSKFGGGDYQNVVFQVTGLDGTPELGVAFAPCAGTTPAFVDCGDGGIEEIEEGSFPEGPDGPAENALIVANNAFSSDVVVVAFQTDGTPIRTVFSGNAALAGTGETTFSVAFNDYLAYDETTGQLLIAGRARIDTDSEVLFVASNPFAVSTAGVTPRTPELVVVNPIRGQASIEVVLSTPSVQGCVVAYDMMGRVVAEIHTGTITHRQRFTLDASDLAAGAYVLRMESGQGALVRTVSVVR